MKIEPTNPGSASNPPTPSSGRSTAPPPGWDPALLKQIEGHLARFAGPVAKVMVRRAGRRTLDVDELYAMMSRELDSEEQRKAFMATRGTLSGAPRSAAAPPRSAAAAATPRTVPQAEVALTAERIEAAQIRLATYIGPIAKILVKKAAAQTSSAERFYLLLAESLSDSDRTRFLKEVGAGASAERSR